MSTPSVWCVRLSRQVDPKAQVRNHSPELTPRDTAHARNFDALLLLRKWGDNKFLQMWCDGARSAHKCTPTHASSVFGSRVDAPPGDVHRGQPISFGWPRDDREWHWQSAARAYATPYRQSCFQQRQPDNSIPRPTILDKVLGKPPETIRTTRLQAHHGRPHPALRKAPSTSGLGGSTG